MADKEIPDMTSGGAAASGDLVHVVRGVNSRKATLGDAAGKSVGTGAGSVAAGDDSRFAAALPKAGGTMTGVLALDDTTNVTTAPPLSFDGDANTGLGHSAADTIEIITGGVARHQIGSDGSQKSVIPGGSTLLPEFACRAWVNFNGTGTVAIRGSGNVSSITDNGTGDYTINFTTALPDANYSVTLAAGGAGSSDPIAWIHGSGAPTVMTASALRVQTGSSAVGSVADANNVHVQIVR